MKLIEIHSLNIHQNLCKIYLTKKIKMFPTHNRYIKRQSDEIHHNKTHQNKSYHYTYYRYTSQRNTSKCIISKLHQNGFYQSTSKCILPKYIKMHPAKVNQNASHESTSKYILKSTSKCIPLKYIKIHLTYNTHGNESNVLLC